MKLLLEQNKKDIIQMYKDGNSTVKIAKKYNCNTGTIWYYLTGWGVKIKKAQKFKGDVEDYRDRIIKLFNEDKSVYKISQELGISEPTLLRFLKSNGFDTHKKYTGNPDHLLKDHEQEVIDLYNNGKTEDEVAKILGFSGSNIHKVLKNSDQEIREPHYHVNENFFDKVDSEVVAYCLGWFYSDGCVDEAGKMRIQIQKDDEAILYQIKNLMEYDGPLYEVPPPKKFPNRKPQVCLCINRKVLADKLILLGCVPNKSLKITLPSFDIVPEHLFHHFIRGAFDGDGSIGLRGKTSLNISLVSCDSFIDPLRIYLSEKLGIETKHYYRYQHTNTLQMMITKTSYASKFCDWMYQGANFYLTRKWMKYQDFIGKGVYV